MAAKTEDVSTEINVVEPPRELTLTDECLQNMDPEKLDFQQVAKLRHPKENEHGEEDTPLQRGSTFLLVLIITGPFYADKRKVIRDTWLSRAPSNVKYYFVVGTRNIPRHSLKDLSNEHRKYKDLLMLADFEDSYDNLSQKVLSMLTWSYENMQYQFILKADDDTFIRLEDLTHELEDPLFEYDYIGYFYGKGTVKRSGQWAETDWFLCEHYLPNARGGAYVLSRQATSYIAKNSKLLQKYRSEDVSVGTWLSPLTIKRHHDIRFDTEYKSRGCHNSWLVTHKQSETQIKQKWQRLVESHGKRFCEEEISHAQGYDYNWETTNRECCIPNEKIP